MKRALIMLCVLVCVMSFAACSDDSTFRGGEGADGRMSVVFNGGFVIIYRDNETGVQYISRANCGTCVMVDRDGKPYIGDGYND